MKTFVLAVLAAMLVVLAIPAVYLVGIWQEARAAVQRAQDAGMLSEPPSEEPLNIAEYVIIGSEFPKTWDRRGIACGPVREVWNLLAGARVPTGKLISAELGLRIIDAERPRPLERLIKAAMAACQLEARYSDTQMLRIWLRRAYFGARAYGQDAAALG